MKAEFNQLPNKEIAMKNAKKFFASMTNFELLDWWSQYGRPHQASHYRQKPRRAAWAEMKRRGLRPRLLRRYPRPKGYGPNHDAYQPFWGLGGSIR